MASARPPIAVVGIGCRFPGGVESVQTFWETLRDGIDTVSDIPSDRFDSSSLVSHGDTRKYGAIRSNRGGFVDIRAFDADFFGYYPTETSQIDPQQRLALEASFHALEDSGTPLERVAGSRTGVFFGSFMSDHASIQAGTEQRDNIGPHVAMGVANCAISNRVSHRLDLQGPSITLDTACSSSLVALHLACQSIWANESDGALAGGVNAILRPESTIMMSKAGFLSPDGTCKSFDAAANGYVRSEGVGVVFLKPLSRALADKDRIYALVRGSLVNQDGYTPEGFTVPSLKAQSALLKSVYLKSGVDPTKVWYVEAHGPGTVVGDPIETNALGQQLGQPRYQSDAPLWVGSLKGNFGHLEGAAGIAGFIKAALVTFYGAIPPQARLKTPNPAIDFEQLRLMVPMKLVDTPPSHTLWVGVNSFGAGGTNAHVVLEKAPAMPVPSSSSDRPCVITLSARTLPALEEQARNLASHLRSQQLPLNQVAYTLTVRQSRHSQVSIIPASSTDELCSRLDLVGSGQASKDVLSLKRLPNKSPKVAFVFSGQGGHWTGMGMKLAEHEPVFRESLAAFDALFTSHAGFSIREEISNGDPSLNKTAVVQPAIAAIQIALAKTLISYGLKPEAIAGHSVGEVAAAHIAGAITLEQAVSVIYFRSKIQSKASGTGSMLAIGLSSTEAERAINRHIPGGSVEVAAANGVKMTTLAGKTEDLEKLAAELRNDGVFARSVNVDVPYHSHYMDPLQEELVEALSVVQPTTTDVALYSTVTALVEPGTHLTGAYWFENVRKPVRYVETASKMLQDGCDFFIEIGPHPVLVSGTREVADSLKLPVQVLPAMFRGNDVEPLSRLMGAAFALGVDTDIHSFNGGDGCLVRLPLYPFQRQDYWLENPEAQQRRLGLSRHPFFGSSAGLTDDGRATLRLRVGTGTSPFLAEHVVGGTIIFPMTGHLEAAYLAATEHIPQQDNVWLENIQFEQPLVLPTSEDFAPQTLLEITSPAKDFVIASRPANSVPSAAWQVCSRGRINAVDSPSFGDAEALLSVTSRVQAGTELDVRIFYEKVQQSGLVYGEAFRAIRKLWRLGNEILSHVQLPSVCHGDAPRFRLHPALLDACIHAMFSDIHYHGDSREIHLPHLIDQVMVFDAQGATSAFAHSQITSRNDAFLRCNATIYDENGRVLALFVGLTVKRLAGKAAIETREHQIYFEPEDAQPRPNRAEVDYSNILVLDPQLPGFDCLLVLHGAFPNATVHHQSLDTASETWSTEKRGYELDRRTLLVVPAIISDSSANPSSTASMVYSALLRITGWLHEQQGTCTFIMLTRGGCLTPVDSQCHPLSSSLQASVRVMVNEFPRARIRIVDLGLDDTNDMALLEDELRTVCPGRDETVVAIRSSGRCYEVLMAVDPEESAKANPLPARGGDYRLEKSDDHGSSNGIIVRQHPPVVLGPDEVAIEVHACGLNFKDVMNSLGLLSDQATAGGLAAQKLGLEIAGCVVRIGENVRDVSIGSRVMATVPNGLAGVAVSDYRAVMPVPSSLSMSEAASIPLAYVTVYYALVYLGRMARGETVLIHAAAGGVGMAAIQVAKLFGARVFATAGSPERRAKVAEMGVEAVFDSRSLEFHNQVKAATGGEGVDLVLNSLAGPMLVQSVACLAPFGRMLEIGKMDIYRNMRLGLEVFGDNRSFFAIDIDRLAGQRPQLHRRMLQSVCTLFDNGQLPAPTVTRFPVTEVSAALNSLSRSDIIGKVAVEMPPDLYVDAVRTNRLQLDGGKGYLITGGTSGLGLHLARFFVERGARHLVLVSRSGPKTPEDWAIIADIQLRGATVHIIHVDVVDATAVSTLFEQSTDTCWPPIAGVIHCAGVSRDILSHEVTMDDFHAVFEPKAIGAWNLHLATQGKNLDFFVMTSSAGSVLCTPGLFSYAGANKFLDALAIHRRASGLTGLSLNFGLLDGFAGMVQKLADPNWTIQHMNLQGMSVLCLPEVLSVLERMMLQETTQRLSMSLDFSKYLKTYPHLVSNGLFSRLGSERDGPQGSDSRGLLSSLSGPERIEMMTETLRSGLAKIVGLEPSRISVTDKLDQYAADSLTLTQMRGMIMREFQITVPIMKLFQGPTLLQLAQEMDSSSDDSQSIDAKPLTNGTTDAHADNVLPKGLSSLSPWLIRGTGSGQRVICFHAMGGAASQFNHFLQNPMDGFDPIAVQLPGRENRANEPFPTSVPDIVAAVVDDLEHSVGAADLFWGHSLGGIIAFEAIRELRRRGKPLPRLLITSTIAPQLIQWLQRREIFLQVSSEEASPEYVMAVSQYVEGADFARSMLPLMRKDAPLLLSYRYEQEDILDIPITAIAARQDDVIYHDEVSGWGAHTENFNCVDMDGNHWSVIPENVDLVWETIKTLTLQ